MLQSGDLPEIVLSVNNTNLMKQLHADQHATILTHVESDEFDIARGTKQGDPLSSLLFKSVLQSAMEKDIGTWSEKGPGIKLGDENRSLHIQPAIC